MLFIRESLRNPAGGAAILPSSRDIAERMVKLAGVARANRIIELGAGTGAITGEILRRMPGAGRLLAIERHPVFVGELQRRFPSILVVRDCASNLVKIAGQQGMGAADAVIATLPWMQFSSPLRIKILEGIRAALSSGGTLVTAASFGGHWLSQGQMFRQHLGRTFGRVGVSAVYFKNFPPLFIYECRQSQPTLGGLSLAA